MIQATKSKDRQNWRKMGGKNYNVGAMISLAIIVVVWFFAAHAVNQPFKLTYLENLFTYGYVCTAKSGNYYAPCNNRFVLCIYHRFPTRNDHGLFAENPSGNVTIYQFPASGTNHGMGSAYNCMVRHRRWSYHFSDCIQWAFHNHSEHSFRCTGYQ